MDTVMAAITGRFTWIPLYLIIFFFACRKIYGRRSNTEGKIPNPQALILKPQLWLLVGSVTVLIILSDQLSVHLFKETVRRYRPCHNLLLKEKVQLINGVCGGLYGFVSSHAANSFALTTFLILFFRNKYFALGMYLWAVIVSYSRVYAGVHYPFDILGGMMLGIFIGLFVYKFYSHINRKYAQ